MWDQLTQVIEFFQAVGIVAIGVIAVLAVVGIWSLFRKLTNTRDMD